MPLILKESIERCDLKRLPLIKEITAKSLFSSSRHPDPWFGVKYTMNLYRGCQHQCIYCDSRSECYQIEDFAEQVAQALQLSSHTVLWRRGRQATRQRKGSPRSAARTSAAMSAEARACPSAVCAAICGVTMTAGWVTNGVIPGGSCSKTSSPAPAR